MGKIFQRTRIKAGGGNRKGLLVLLFFAWSATSFAQVTRAQQSVTRSCATNFATDLLGEPDTRIYSSWGLAQSDEHRITFKPPVGWHVRILRVYGDFVVWPSFKAAEAGSSGALLALHTTAPEGSASADLAADNTMLYVQVATSGKPERAAFDNDVRDGGLLEADNVLVVKLAVFLNTTGVKIHMEPSLVLVYRFEPPIA